ncbi:MAG TPA: hypothetical protein VHY81_08770 [Acidimicrobiales bacterium]|jgi:hypothetical protein|nr:hypothetical protein [Acidimicrobiales bacterium]
MKRPHRRRADKQDQPAQAALIGVDRLLRNVRHGRFERSLAGLTSVGAVITGLEIWLEHDRASFSNRMMWLPVALTPGIAVAGAAGVVSRRAAKTVLPLASAVVLVNSIQGQYLHLRGIAQRPGGWRMLRYNAEMGPPTFAPLLFGLVGGMGLVASILRRED